MPQPLMLRNLKLLKKLKLKKMEILLEGHKRPSRTNIQKRCPFHHRGLKCKSRKTQIPGVIGKFGLGIQNKVT